jgi:hemolysin activation/secretion protein
LSLCHRRFHGRRACDIQGLLTLSSFDANSIAVRCTATVLVSLLLAASARSQTPAPPPPASTANQELRRQDERERNQREQLERAPDVRLNPQAQAAPGRLPLEANCFVIQQVLLKTTPTEKPQLSNQFSWVVNQLAGPDNNDAPQGRCLGSEGVSLVLKRAQDALVARGFVTSRIVTEPQNLAQGTLQLTLLPGRIRAIRFAESVDKRARSLNAVPAAPGDILNLRDIEQALENFKRVPTAEADIKITPAEPVDGEPDLPGESDLLITYKQAFPVRVSLSADDGGSKATGKYQGSLTVGLDNFLTLNDLFYVTLSRDLGGAQTPPNVSGKAQGTRGNTAHYSVPYGYWTLGATVSNSNYFQSVAGLNQNYVYRGSSSNAEVKIQRLVYRDATGKTTLSAKAFQRRSKNFIDDTEIEVQRRSVGGWEAGVNHRQYIGQSTLDINAAYKRGTGAFGSLAAPEELFGEGTSRFALATVDINLSVPFKLGEQQLRYGGLLRAQSNATALTPQDRFAIGGRYTVRGFDGESSLSAERGWLLRNELSLGIGDLGAELYAALDHAEVAGSGADLLVGKSLTGAALGVRGGLKKFQYDCFVAAPVAKPTLFQTASTTAGCSFNFAF